MRKTSTAVDLRQVEDPGRVCGEEANPWRESLEQRLRERMRELIEQVLEEEVEEALGAGRSQRAATRSGYRHGSKGRGLVLRGGAVRIAVPRAPGGLGGDGARVAEPAAAALPAGYAGGRAGGGGGVSVGREHPGGFARPWSHCWPQRRCRRARSRGWWRGWKSVTRPGRSVT